jgi:hypothetical protein
MMAEELVALTDKMLAESMVEQLVELKANYMVALMEH